MFIVGFCYSLISYLVVSKAMKILGVIGQTNIPLGHDGSAALIIDSDVIMAIEQERLTRSRYAMGQGAANAASLCLKRQGLTLADIDFIAFGWLPVLKDSNAVSDNIRSSSEMTQVILPPEQFQYTVAPPIYFIQHHYTHAAVTYYTSGFDSAAVLVIDGRGEGESISLYHAKGNQIELIESYPMLYSLGTFYSAAGSLARLGGIGGFSGPGKLMGLAPFGQVRQAIEFFFDADTGRFTLPTEIQQAVEASLEPPTAGMMGKFWHDYYQQSFYPYDGHEDEDSVAYDILHYADLAAAVQQKLEQICLALAKRVKQLTGEKNLVMSGGCALNCSMNAYLSRQNVFDNIYVFPAANDAGCSIGAALALSHTLKTPRMTPQRLISPDFGRAYSNPEIVAAIDCYGLTPHKLMPDQLAERVATDLTDNKVVAWFRGRDEFGPRALGRRSFIANPIQRENLGHLNRIKGREMWRPLAPSILEEFADTVLEGSMELGLHRYMLGVATIKPQWRTKIPAVVHVDFTCRPHFVQREHDGLYWQVIYEFHKKTGIPLVCNTSLNVAGQPLVHKLEEVLDIFISCDNVQTLVIEDFYLTKQNVSDRAGLLDS
ncbi:MAG: carbamoyltransferase [Crocosphaera sp.]